ncbi:phosphatidylserine/phosphatidylglycerophosphate/cardiolipin synthase family protein [Methanomicrobium sp. W14]|uniref:phospholipase D-like domain-containing protein n=1 Tax=Methanomicrobium sp. W14 TaxID=2817839 RepID=UPI001AE14DAB|nr:phosphatidylserine/phosphatidylglycerophosphate/cardiolipin synthase family protein [Methanomicrobium sp. W14]
MAINYSGNILKSLEKPIQETFSFEDEILGTCWESKKVTDLNNLPVFNGDIIKENQRDFIIPSKNGELITYLVKNIKKAHNEIYLSSFLIQKSPVTEALLEAENRGVKIFLLTAREEDLKNINSENLEEESDIIKEHIALLNSFAGKILVRTCDSFHAKYILIDPLSDNPFGLMMTCNATVDPMTGSNIEIAVSLKNDEILSFFSHFLNGFWEMADHELLEPGKLRAVKKDLSFKPDLGEITLPVTTNKSKTLRKYLIELITGAKKSIYITGWSFDPGYQIVKELENASSRGVSIQIGTKQTPKSTKALLKLAEHNASILGHSRFHAKCVLVDGESGIITTSNFTRLGLESGFETSVLLNKDEVKKIESIISEWFKSCPWKLSHSLLLGVADDKILELSKTGDNLIDFSIITEEERSIPDFSPQSLEQIINYTIQKGQAEKIRRNVNDKKIKKLTLSQKIIPPKLAKNAKKEEHKEIPFPVYNTGKGLKCITISKWEDINSAKEFAHKLNAKIVLEA